MGISTHILDVTRGRPAADVPVTLEFETAPGTWQRLGEGRTNEDGRVKSLLPDGASFAAGSYRITFAVRAYFTAFHAQSFYPEVAITFTVANPAEHFHVPLLLSPFGYSTYRGS
jgi:5-hydroxyisourate hydrolase